MISTEVLAALDRGTLLLTPNERAARTLQRAWDRIQHSRQLTTWEPAKILSWRSWLQLLWKRLLLDGRVSALLLTPLQEQHVWRGVITTSAAAASLRSIDSLVDLAAKAWRRVCAYGGQQLLRRSSHHLQGDPLQFALWARSFEDVCRQESLLSEALLEDELIQQLTPRDFRLAGALEGALLLGFDRLLPAQGALLESLRLAGGSVVQGQEPGTPHGLLVTAPDQTEELRTCALWIRARLRDVPDARIALIVNNLDLERDTIDSVLRELLSPELEDIAANSDLVPFEFSLGRPMAHQPMVQSALDLLHWALEPLPLEKVSRLLLSPYFAAEDQEVTARAEFDAFSLRQQLRLRPEITLSGLGQELEQSENLHGRLSGLFRAIKNMEEAQSKFDLHPRGFAEWSDWMRAWLARSQWCTSVSSLTSHEYQLRERWESALDQLASLDFVNQGIDLQQALDTLDRLSKELIFAPEANDAPVQILGPLEAAGQSFDALWLLRGGEMQWPPSAATLPLLSWSLQRELQMPGTDAERERAAAFQLTRRLAASSHEFIVSYAHSTASEGSQRAAAILRELQLSDVPLDDLIGQEQPTNAPVTLERVLDATGITPLPDQVLPGGVRILELQAACGFRAFAELRLGASELRERGPGLNSMERGSAVHSALEEFWKTLESQRELRALSQVERDEMIQRAVEAGLNKAQTAKTTPWDSAYLRAQRLRLTTLLHDWIQMELRRPEFTVVAQEEARKNIALGPLRLSLRMDRIDLVDGQQVVLDYKTGSANTSGWLGDRPDQPQVPLYAILASKGGDQSNGTALPLAAVGFGQVRAGKDMSLRGFAAAPGILHAHGSVRPASMDAESFDAQIVRWHEILERLAIEFAEGDLRVRPKQYPATCVRCGQRLLCRLDTSSIANETLTEDASMEEADQQHG